VKKEFIKFVDRFVDHQVAKIAHSGYNHKTNLLIIYQRIIGIKGKI